MSVQTRGQGRDQCEPSWQLEAFGWGVRGIRREVVESRGEMGAGPMETCGQGEVCFASKSIVLSIC